MDGPCFCRRCERWACTATCHFPISHVCFLCIQSNTFDLNSNSSASWISSLRVVHLILRPSIGHRPCLAHINSRLLNTRLTVLHTWVVSLTSEYICSSYFLANISDDKVEGLQLSFAFDLTCRARKVNKSHSWWQHRTEIDSTDWHTKHSTLSPPIIQPPRPSIRDSPTTSDHIAAHFRSGNEASHRFVMIWYKNLARCKEWETKKLLKRP